MPEKRNWKEYNEHLIRQGEILFSLDFLSEVLKTDYQEARI